MASPASFPLGSFASVCPLAFTKDCIQARAECSTANLYAYQRADTDLEINWFTNVTDAGWHWQAPHWCMSKVRPVLAVLTPVRIDSEAKTAQLLRRSDIKGLTGPEFYCWAIDTQHMDEAVKLLEFVPGTTLTARHLWPTPAKSAKSTAFATPAVNLRFVKAHCQHYPLMERCECLLASYTFNLRPHGDVQAKRDNIARKRSAEEELQKTVEDGFLSLKDERIRELEQHNRDLTHIIHDLCKRIKVVEEVKTTDALAPYIQTMQKEDAAEAICDILTGKMDAPAQ